MGLRMRAGGSSRCGSPLGDLRRERAFPRLARFVVGADPSPAFRALAGVVAAVIVAGGAQAQTLTFKVPRQPAAEGVAALGRQADIQILITDAAAQGRVTNAVAGRHSPRQALALLLAGTGLKAQPLDGRTWVVIVEPATPAPKASTRLAIPDTPVLLPELLVEGARSLNTGVRRTADDSRPYVVFTAQDIERSGAVNLETFFRDQLGANAAIGTADQNGDTVRGLTGVNLRGLTPFSTLVLIDGRRAPSPNNGSGVLMQPTLVGLPLASIQRIEVLASSTSGIYGANAAGGVVNIILKRDYEGLEVTTSWSDVVEGSAPEARIDVQGGKAFDEGRTRVSFSASWTRRDALARGDRDFSVRARALAAETTPDYWATRTAPPLGATANIRSASGSALQLDPAWGGGALGSAFTSLPKGYRGLALDGVDTLVRNAGSYNLALADNAAGAGATLTTGARNLGGYVTLRQDITPTLSVYGELAASRSEEFIYSNGVPSIVTLDADAPNNPFQQAIQVAVPHTGADVRLPTLFHDRRVGAGLVLQLGHDWKASLDLSASRSRLSIRDSFAPVDAATWQALNDGGLDVLRDLALYPLTYAYETGYGVVRLPSISTSREAAVRLGGPLPLNLPGGRAAATLSAQHIEQVLGDSIVVSATSFTLTPWRAQTTDSLYAEARLPLLSAHNGVPMVRGLELQVAGRLDRYVGEGADAQINCAAAKGELALLAAEACARPGQTAARGRAVKSHFDPAYSLKWDLGGGVTMRASWATGYLPPYLSELVPKRGGLALVNVRDPLRGREVVGTPLGEGYGLLQGDDLVGGGNPDVDPQLTTSRSIGLVVEPWRDRRLRVSIDWTGIVTTGAYYTPVAILLSGGTMEGQATFENYLRRYPERIKRGLASDGYAVGPIIGVDVSTANASRFETESIDVAVSRASHALGGELELSATGNWLTKLTYQTFDWTPAYDHAGVASAGFSAGFPILGGLAFRANASAVWSKGRMSIGWRGRYVGGYYLRQDHAVVALQGANRIPSQTYHDLFARFEVKDGLLLDLGVNNVLNRAPPLDLTVNGSNSRAGDSRRAVYRVALTQRF